MSSIKGRWWAWIILLGGTLLWGIPAPRMRSERGLSQSTENALLLAGAAALAGTVVAVVTAYVTARLPR